MNKMNTILFVVVALFCVGVSSFAQSTNGIGGGPWSKTTTWSGGKIPTTTASIIVSPGDTLYIDTDVTITGTFKSLSTVAGSGRSAIKVDTSKKVIFASGSTFEQAADSGAIPVATWQTGSTCLITGTVARTPGNGNQNFYNFTWNCPNQQTGANLNLGMSGNTIAGNFEVDSTGAGRIYLTSPTAYTTPITINGNLILKRGQWAVHGSSTALTAPLTFYSVIINGDIIVDGVVNGISFAPTRGSANPAYLRVNGNMSIANSRIATSNNLSRIIFGKNGTQTLTITGSPAWTTTGVITWEVANTSTLNLGTSVISGTASVFIVDSGATVYSGSAQGLVGNLTNGGGDTLSINASYGYSGINPQKDTLLPSTVKNLTINNDSGFTLTKPTKINGVLTLQAGKLDNTIPFTLGPGATISYSGGILKIPVLAVGPSRDNIIPEKFSVQQNYPNPFNPTTVISYQLSVNSFVTLKVYDVLGKEVASLVNETKEAGSYSAKFDATNLTSGVYFYQLRAGSVVETKRMILLK